jgi:hypothetical protein
MRVNMGQSFVYGPLGAVGRKTRRAGRVANSLDLYAPVLSRGVRMPAMENSHEPTRWRLGCSGGSGTPTARLKTGAKTLEQLATSSACRVLRPTDQGHIGPRP